MTFAIELQRIDVRLPRLVQLAEFFQHVAHIVVGVGKVGLERERSTIMLERRFQIAALEVDAAHHVDDIVVVGIEPERTFGGSRSLIDLVLIDENAGIVQMELVDFSARSPGRGASAPRPRRADPGP